MTPASTANALATDDGSWVAGRPWGGISVIQLRPTVLGTTWKFAMTLTEATQPGSSKLKGNCGPFDAGVQA